MAAMTTVLTEFADNGNSRTYALSDHTASSPSLVLQKRKLASAGGVASSTIQVVKATEDVDGATLPQKVNIAAIVSTPIDGDAADVAAALATFRDIVAGDEFGTTVTTQRWLS
jgi:hypothetical protein